MTAAGVGFALEAMTAGEVLRERLAGEEAARVARRREKWEEDRRRPRGGGIGDMGQGLLFADPTALNLFSGRPWCEEGLA